MFIAIGIVFLLIYAALVFYIGWSGWSFLKPAISKRFKLLYILLISFLAISFILGRFFSTQIILQIIGAYWLALFSLLLLLLPVAHLIIWLFSLTRLPRQGIKKTIGILLLTALIGIIGFGSFSAYSPVVRPYAIMINKPAQVEQPLNIVVASDMHFGILSGKNHAQRMVNMINELKPDLVLFPGDIIDDQLAPVIDQDIPAILANIESTYGVYASLGNHDKTREGLAELISVIESSNINVLYDEVTLIEDQFYIIGRKDHSDKARIELSELTEGLDHTKPIIAMDHQPKDLGIAADHGIDLILSGHTHRGQIAPAHLITQRLFENDWGYLRKNDMHSIVSSGYGFWGPPIRIGSRSEIVQIHVTFE
ncbi:metallophosphoesterase [Paenibacillus sp. GXUN7292]|uniref:metallophosphoesterase n=1 Tax=Paenibacillus sp. GXUN7292 TaxID=3422499 RepID=UPI003D7D32DF